MEWNDGTSSARRRNQACGSRQSRVGFSGTVGKQSGWRAKSTHLGRRAMSRDNGTKSCVSSSARASVTLSAAAPHLGRHVPRGGAEGAPDVPRVVRRAGHRVRQRGTSRVARVPRRPPPPLARWLFVGGPRRRPPSRPLTADALVFLHPDRHRAPRRWRFARSWTAPPRTRTGTTTPCSRGETSRRAKWWFAPSPRARVSARERRRARRSSRRSGWAGASR